MLAVLEVLEETDKQVQVELVNNIQFQVQMFIMLAEVPAVEEVQVVLLLVQAETVVAEMLLHLLLDQQTDNPVLLIEVVVEVPVQVLNHLNQVLVTVQPVVLVLLLFLTNQ